MGRVCRLLDRSANFRKDETRAMGFFYWKPMSNTFTPRTEYAKKLLDPRWQQLRLRVFERDGWKCRCCNETSSTLHAHHVAYHPLADGPWDYNDAAIITLCHYCHTDEHETLKAAQASVLLALAKCGHWSSEQLVCLADRIEESGVI